MLKIMDEPTLSDILDDLLVLINANLSSEKVLTMARIQEANDGMIKPSYGEKEIVFALKHISDQINEI